MSVFRWSTIAAASFLLVVPKTGWVSTIDCPDLDLDTPSWVAKRFAEADVVLLGRVTQAEFASVTTVAPSADDRAETMGELLERIEQAQAAQSLYSSHLWQSVSFEVLRVWKGPASKVFSAKNRVVPGQYGELLAGKNVYLVFGYEQEDGIYTISTVCGDTKSVRDAAERILELDKLTN